MATILWILSVSYVFFGAGQIVRAWDRLVLAAIDRVVRLSDRIRFYQGLIKSTDVD